MRLQLALGPLALASAIGAPLWPRLAPWAVVLFAAFLVTTLPFVWRERRRPAVALAGPVLFFVRALAISGGLAAGLARLAVLRSGRPGAERAPLPEAGVGREP
jgi:hypothetical protein